MAAVRLGGRPDTLPVKSLSTFSIPGMTKDREGLTVPCPSSLEGDDTAFACYIIDESLMPVIKPGSLLYCSRMRDPIKGDIVVIFSKERGFVRIVTDLHEDGYETIHMVRDEDDTFRSVPDITPFEDLEDISLVVGTNRFMA